MLHNWLGLSSLAEYLRAMIHPLWFLAAVVLLYSTLLVILCNAYVSTLLLFIYKKTNNLPGDTNSKLWDNPRKMIASFVDTIGKILHGYEVIGVEHLPEGPGVIVYYHGAAVLDYAFLVARLYAQSKRCLYSVIERGFYLAPDAHKYRNWKAFVDALKHVSFIKFAPPSSSEITHTFTLGLKLYLDVIFCTHGNRADCVEILKKGNLLGIAPGGLREANFGDENYNLIWGNRTGFAQVALEAKVPIIPMFTQNVREGYRTIGKTRLTRWLYEHTRLLPLPVYGGIPVKFRTYIGEPIPYDSNMTAVDLTEKTKIAIENLRNRYQKRPGNILRALSERFGKHHKDI